MVSRVLASRNGILGLNEKARRRTGVRLRRALEFKGDRSTKSKPIPGRHLIYGFLTTAPNAIVEPIHPKAMPVILTTPEECDGMDARAMG